jgi:hypothetical protein
MCLAQQKRVKVSRISKRTIRAYSNPNGSYERISIFPDTRSVLWDYGMELHYSERKWAADKLKEWFRS